jgi:DNA-binding NarL/FixJ family response regulator
MGRRTTLRVAPPPSQIRALPILREAWLDEARTTLGHDGVETLLSGGRAMTTGDAVRFALRAGLSSSADTSLTDWSPLTRREQEVARLVARGFTNRQIAAELVVTESTAAKHVENIREKLGRNSRTQVGAWVRDHQTMPMS